MNRDGKADTDINPEENLDEKGNIYCPHMREELSKIHSERLDRDINQNIFKTIVKFVLNR